MFCTDLIRKPLMAMAWLAAATSPADRPTLAGPSKGGEDARPAVLLDNARVLVFRASGPIDIRVHSAAVVVPLEDGATHKAGDAYWSGDPVAPHDDNKLDVGPLIIVEPKEPAASGSGRTTSAGGGLDGHKPAFAGISFKPLFENGRVTVIRGRMEVGAEEAFHTHTSDIVVVHLSGGAIEDTADGRTKTNRWRKGDVEFEASGSSHSARNVGSALDAVLITIKP